VLEDTLLSAKKNNFVAAVAGEGPVGVATLDVSTGEFETWESEADSLRDELGRLEPAEVLAPDGRGGVPPEGPWSVTRRDAWRFEEAFAEETLCREFDVESTEGFGFEPGRDGHMLRAAGALLAYLDEVRPSGLEHLQVPEERFRALFAHLAQDPRGPAPHVRRRFRVFHDLVDRGPLLLRDIRGAKPIQRVAGLPFVAFDQIQNVALYRRGCLEEYCWDPEYRIGWEHTDFFLGHREETGWSFGVCPEVMFRHHPGGDAEYVSMRRSRERIRASKRYFLEKWGYDQVLNGRTNWLETHDGVIPPDVLLSELAKHALLRLPARAQGPLMDLRDRIRWLRGDPPF
jgi:hypothetical protein